MPETSAAPKELSPVSVTRRRRLYIGVAVILLVVIAGLAFYIVEAPANLETVTISIPVGAGSSPRLNFNSSRINLVLGVNNSVEWVDHDPLKPHNVVSKSFPTGAKGFGSDSLSLIEGDVYGPIVLNIPGVYTYRSLVDAAWMNGTIIVTA
jgi:hypothetical protein